MEGPSLVILKEEVQSFKGKKVIAATGYADLDFKRLKNKTVKDFKTWGKHFLVVFPQFTLRIHFLLFGTYYINSKKSTNPKVTLKFSNGELNCYICSAKILEEPLKDLYDWELDLLDPSWNSRKVRTLVKEHPEEMICDVILNPDIFSGAGNIIKNEALYRSAIHPETKVKDLPAAKLTRIIKDVHDYTHNFLTWKKEGTLSKKWKVYAQKKCKDCGTPIKKKYDGKLKRRSFVCDNHQVKYVEGKAGK